MQNPARSPGARKNISPVKMITQVLRILSSVAPRPF